MNKSLSFACLVCASALLSAAVACSASASSSDFGTESKDRDAAGGAPGQADAGGLTSDRGDAIDSLVLVHASPNLPAFRMCFDALPSKAPLPRSRPMPRSNTVGVDVGSATYLDVAEDLVALRDAGGLLLAHVISVDELADKANVPCDQLMENLRSRNQLGVNYWDVSVPEAAVGPGAHAIAIVGCSNAFGSDRPECVVTKNGTVDQKNGTIAVKVLELPGRTTRFFSVAGALLTPRSDVVTLKFRDLLGNPLFGQITELKEQRDNGSDFEPSEIEGLKFATIGGASVTQSMIDTQAYTAPLVLPRLYFQHDNPVTLVLLGAQNPIPGHPGRALHLIAIPSRDPERPVVAPDAGTLPTFDAGADAARDAKTD